MNNKNKAAKKLSLLAGVLILLIAFSFSPIAENVAASVSTFTMLETIALLDNLMTPIDSKLVGEKQVIAGANKAALTVALANLNNVQLDNWIQRSQTKALLIWRQGEIVHESYSPNYEQGLSINGLSMAKTITALLIGIAIDEGLIKSEEESVLNYLPEIILEEGDSVTIKNLLQQESGMRDDFPDILATLKGESLEEELDDISFSDDKEFQYSNVNYHLLSLILKRVYQKELNDILSEKIWQPLVLEEAKVVNSTGYCCIFATARSWLAIGELILNEGKYQEQQIVSKAWLDKMRDDKVGPDSFVVQLSSKAKGNTYAYHIFSGLEDFPDLYWSEGMGLQLLLIDPINKIIVVRLGDIPTTFKIKSNRWDQNLGEGLLEVMQTLH